MSKYTGFITAAILAAVTATGALAASPTATPAPVATTAAPAVTAPASPAQAQAGSTAPAQTAPATQAKASPSTAAHHGMMAKSQVQAIQTALNSNGEKVAVDGLFGHQTRGAIKDFQQKHGIKATGHADQATLAQLKVSSKT